MAAIQNNRLNRPTPDDGYPTPTSKLQAWTENILLDHRQNESEPTLNRNAHLQWLTRNMIKGFPARYESQDASQPWLLFWTLQSFSVMQVALNPGNKQRVIEKVMSWQHPDGGFCGGPGQMPHLLPTYSALCALAIAGGPGPEGGWDQVDKEKMYSFFMSLKEPDGSFRVAAHSEVDVRGIYSLLVSATLLNIMTPELVKGTATFLASCQTYEGGFASASHPFYSEKTDRVLRFPRPTLGEAHGGYTYCALASWVILQSYLDSSPPAIPAAADGTTFDVKEENPESQWDYEKTTDRPQIDIKKLTRWLVDMQGTDIELGGFRGRTNKLVDGCYSWWCGGAFALLEYLGVGGLQNMTAADVEADEVVDEVEREAKERRRKVGEGGHEHEAWDDIDESLFDRKALQEYILLAGQHPKGGLRDKPPKSSDAYHTLYCLSGLSAAQHHVYSSHARKVQALKLWKDDATPYNPFRKALFTDMVSWTEEEGTTKIVGPIDNRLNATHPLTNLTITHTEAMMKYFYAQEAPSRISSVSPKKFGTAGTGSTGSTAA